MLAILRDQSITFLILCNKILYFLSDPTGRFMKTSPEQVNPGMSEFQLSFAC